MAADKQYADAKAALRVIEQSALAQGSFLTYGSLAKQLGYEAQKHARHVGQLCSLIDAACYWTKLPMLSLEKIRSDDGTYNADSFTGEWSEIKDTLIRNSASRPWSADDINKLVKALDLHMNGEGAILQWAKIDSFGRAARDRAASYR